MKKQSKQHEQLRYWVWGVAALLCLAGVAWGGSLDSPAPPTSAASALYTLQDIYNRLDAGTAGSKRTGAFTEPSAGPGSTMHTTDEIMAKAPAVDGSGASAGDVLSGKTYWGLTSGAWGKKTGTLPTATLSASSTAVSAGYYAATTLPAVDADLASGNIKSGVNLFGVAGKTEVVDTTTGDAAADDVLSGKKAWVDGAEVTGTMAMRTLSAANGTVAAGYYAATTLSAVDADLAAGNIKKDTVVFGIIGTLEGGGGSAYPAPVARTGQTPTVPLTAPAGSDGALQKGVAWPSPRFVDNNNGTVTDQKTGLIWLKNANAFSYRKWAAALTDCATLNSGEKGLTDGSVEGDWRLPNIEELLSLVAWQYCNPALADTAGTAKWTEGNPFTGVKLANYWSSSTNPDYPPAAWCVGVGIGGVDNGTKTDTLYVWPVRGGP